MAEDDAKGPGEQLGGTGGVKTGYAWIGTKLREVKYTEVDGHGVVEGCIVLGTLDKLAKIDKAARAALESDDGSEGVFIESPFFRWPNATMPYRVRDDLPAPERVDEAIAHWRSKTDAVTFVERTAANAAQFPNFVTFRRGSGCSSSVGCQRGEQFVNLGDECSTGNVIHEIGHTLGLWHEQSREDRDQHVTVLMDRVMPAFLHNFDQHIRDGVDSGDYDFGSIMHYPRTAFSADGSETIIPKDPNAQIGQRQALSPGDVAAVEQMYRK